MKMTEKMAEIVVNKIVECNKTYNLGITRTPRLYFYHDGASVRFEYKNEPYEFYSLLDFVTFKKHECKKQ